MNATVQSRTVAQVSPFTPDPALLSTPYGKTSLEIPLNQGFPFHRVYFGRISGAGTNYNERIRIGLKLKGRIVWELVTQECNLDLASVIEEPNTFGISTEQVFSPQYCIETHEIDADSGIVDVNPRQMLSAQDVMVFNCRIRTSLTKDLVTRIFAAPVTVTQLADTVFLEVSHDPALTTPDLDWAQRVYALGCHSSITR